MGEMKNMKNILLAFGATLAILLTLSTVSCSDASQLGAELFNNDTLNLKFTDTLTVNAVTDPVDSILVQTANGGFTNMLLGNVADPTFGNTDARIYTQLTTGTSLPDFNFIESFTAYVDLVYNPKRVYGDTSSLQRVNVYRLTDTIISENIYSNKKRKSESTPIASYLFSPKPNTTEMIITIIKDDAGAEKRRDTTFATPRIRIPVDKSFAQKIIDLDTTSKTNFTSWLKGLEIRVENPTNCMMGFNLAGTGINPSGLTINYKKTGDTTNYTYTFPTASLIKYTNFNLGHATAPIKPFIGNKVKGDSLLFVQGFAGTDVKFEFPHLKNLGNVVINKAELELTVADGNNIETFPAIEQLTLKTAQFVGTKDLNLDASYSGSVIAELLSTSGGTVRNETVNGVTVKKYYLNLSSHLQLMLNGKQGTVLYLTPHLKEQKGSRVVLYGSKHSKYRAKLNITYTKL
jgi:Domain of unknown function (DUF4270)